MCRPLSTTVALSALVLVALSACADDPAPTELETESLFELGGG